MQSFVHAIESAGGKEIHATICPDPSADLPRQAEQAFAAVAQILDSHSAYILQERIFAPPAATAEIAALRRRHYGHRDDGVSPAWLAGGADGDGGLRAVQVHAVTLDSPPQTLSVDGTTCARLVQRDKCRWLTASALPTCHTETSTQQTRRAFVQAEALLRIAGGDISNVARTWFFLDDIHAWYGDFNAARSRFFSQRGLLGGPTLRLPASTGIGVTPASGARCAMDFIAVLGDLPCQRGQHCLCRHLAAGMQRSAYEYGSSFARAATACTPAGRTVYISGTAAIDPEGRTCHLGNIPGQVEMALECATAVVRDLQCPTDRIVQAIAYVTSPEVEAAFRAVQKKWPAPWIIVPGNICRDDLLFEVELTASPGARRLN